mmetsp:Transcript_37612/g.70154  ORF Transcript_37612/g.70154 Transcript_37612/m.70154 type:complete len:225 (-) Transcript_37612:97-771(-)
MFFLNAFASCCSNSADCGAVFYQEHKHAIELPTEAGEEEEVEDLEALIPDALVIRFSRRRSSVSLGLDFDKIDPENLMVVKILQPGLIFDYNQRGDTHKVCPGDRVRTINGKQAPANELLVMLQEELELVIELQHCKEMEHFFEKKNKSLGLELAVLEKATCLTVQRIDPNGLVASWNETAEGKKIKVHDKIVSVDGVRGSAPEMMKKIKDNDSFILTVYSWDI